MNRHALLACVWGLALVGTTASVARGQTTYTWNGASNPANGNWSDGTNWGGTAPINELTLTRISLAGTTNLTTELDFGGTFDINGLTVANGAGAFIVNSTVTPTILRIGGNGVAVNANNNFTVNAAIALGANQTWTNAGTGVFSVGAVNLAGNALTTAGAGATRITGTVSGGGTITNNGTNAAGLVVSGAVDLSGGGLTLGGSGATNVTGVVSGSNGLTKTGTGTVTISGVNTNTGPVQVNQGVLAVNRRIGGATVLGTGPVTLNGGTLSFRSPATPVTLTAASFNHDVIVSAADGVFPSTNPFGTTAAIDAAPGASTNGGWALMQNNPTLLEVYQMPTNLGLPASRTFVSAANPATTYQLAAYDNGTPGGFSNNGLFMSGDAGASNTGTITLATAAPFEAISLLVTSGSASSNFNAVLRFSDNTTVAVNGLASPDWFNGNPFAITNLGRFDRLDGNPDTGVTANNPRLYGVDIAIPADFRTKNLSSIEFTRLTTTGGRLVVFGLSGSSNTGAGPLTYANNVTVSASSTLDVANTPAMTLGSLAFTANATLSTTGPVNSTLAFTGTTLGGNPTFNIFTGQVFNGATIDFGNAARTVTKGGNGVQQFDFAGSNVNGTNTFVVTGGTANVGNASAFGANPNLQVTGGTANMTTYTGLNNLTVSGGTANLPLVTAVNGVATISGGTTNLGAAVTIPTATISGGTTNINAGATIAAATMNGGTVNVNSAASIATLSGTGGTLNVSGANVLTVGGATASTWGGVLAGTGTVNKVGTGALTLTTSGGTNTGGITISAGQITATQPGSLGAGPVSLTNGTTLAIGGNPPPVTTISGFGGAGTGWTFNGGPTAAADVLTITTNAGSLARSAWHNTAQSTGSFTALFDYANGPASGNRADGFTFTLQNRATDPLLAVGGAGGSLGYSGITPSASVQVNIFSNNGRGVAFRTNGAVAGGGNYASGNGVDVGSGNTVSFRVAYNATTQALNIRMTQGANVFDLPTQTVNLGTLLGANAFVGFTGGTGGETAEQRISNFSFATGIPGLANYSNAVNVSGTATLTPTMATGVTTFGMGALGLADGATLNVQAGGSLPDTAYTLNMGATTVPGTGTLNVLNNGTGTGTVVLGAISGAGSLVKTGNGTLVFGAAATHVNTTVGGGTLMITGTAAPTGTVTVQSGTNLMVSGTLGAGGAVENSGFVGGTGTIGRAVNVQNGGVIAAGAGTAVGQTLTYSGALTFSNGGTLRTVVSSAGGLTNTTTTGAGLINGTGTGVLNRSSTSDVINVLLVNDTANPVLIDGSATYVRRLATYNTLGANMQAGPSTAADGVFNVTGQGFTVASNWSIDISGGNVTLTFTPVPEPTTVLGIAAAGMGLAGLARRLRRRAAGVEPTVAV